jgi:hypothetical protein
MKYIINHISEDIFLQKLAIIHYKEVLGHCFPGKRIRLIAVKLAHVVTSIKQLPVFKGHLFLSCHRKFDMN